MMNSENFNMVGRNNFSVDKWLFEYLGIKFLLFKGCIKCCR